MVGLGIEDEAFIRGKVPMTKQEIRVLTMVKARISPTDIVWDVGAGTGSMSVEALDRNRQPSGSTNHHFPSIFSTRK